MKREKLALVAPETAKILESVRDLAVEVGGYQSFPELAALALVRRFCEDGRPLAARRVIRSYLARHPMTPRIAQRLSTLA